MDIKDEVINNKLTYNELLELYIKYLRKKLDKFEELLNEIVKNCADLQLFISLRKMCCPRPAYCRARRSRRGTARFP